MISNKDRCLPFWSWNDELDEKELTDQMEWFHHSGIGGFFMHARTGLKTEYLGEKWFSCIEACLKKAKELNMEAYAYDENGWPSGFAGGKLLEKEENRDCYLTYKRGPYDKNAFASYDDSKEKLVRVNQGDNVFNVYVNRSVATADILNKDVVRQFIELTHEQYKKHDIYHNLRGFFTDEPQYYRWGTSFTYCLVDYFKEHYQEDIKDRLGLLFLEKEGYQDFRYKYWLAMQDLMLNSYSKQIYDWCEENGYSFTGHYVEETSLAFQMMACGGIMPFYQYETIPGMDWLGRFIQNEMPMTQVYSVACQLGKPRIICETFACVGWDTTPRELKQIAEVQYVGGINLMCQHLLPYHEHGERKRDYPEHYSKINPWVEDSFKQFNDYFTELGYKLAHSTQPTCVGVLHPIRSCYFTYQRDDLAKSDEDINNPFVSFVQKLSAMHLPHHYLDETVMETQKAYVKDGKLVVGKCTYSFIILPKIYTMGKYFERLLETFIQEGGKVYLADKKPTYCEGKPFDYSFLKSNTTLEEMKAAYPFEDEENEAIRLTYRISEEGKLFVYLVNTFNVPQKFHFAFKGYKNLKKEDGTVISPDLSLDNLESLVLTPTNEEITKVPKRKILKPKDTFQVEGTPLNYYPIDRIEYSKDGVHFSKPLLYMGIQDTLLKERYEGDIYLRYSFLLKSIPSSCFALIENTNTLEVKVNGKRIEKIGTVLEKDLWKYQIESNLKEGRNEIEVKVHYFQKEEVYQALFGSGDTEALKNKLVYDTTIEAVYLCGDFGVYGTFQKGKKENIYLGKDFYLDKPKKTISSTILDSYPFFRGKLTLSQDFDLKDTNYVLFLEKRFQTVRVKVNGVEAGNMMFSRYLDLSSYLHKGKNHIEYTLTISNRNLLGPLHDIDEEPMAIGPNSFEQVGTWKDGESNHQRKDYALVEAIL